MPPVYLGVDPSLTGLALVTRSSRQIVSTKPASFPCFPARLDHLLQEASRAIARLRPTLVAIEGFSYASKGGAAVERNGLGVGLRWMLWRNGIPYLEVAPRTLKKYVTGKGNSEKNLIIRDVHIRWAYLAQDDNDADAYALCRLAEDWAEGSATTKWLQHLRKSVPITLGRGSKELALPSRLPATT